MFSVDSDTDADLQAAIRASMEEADHHDLALKEEDVLVLAAAAHGLPTPPTTPGRKRSYSAQVRLLEPRACLTCWFAGRVQGW